MNSKQKNIFIILLLALSLLLCACQSNNESMPTTTAAPTVPTIPINPLADKQYEPFVYDAGADFFAFLDPLNAEYSEHLINMADYFTKHANEIEVEGKGLSDFDDYEENFDAYYCFLYGIMFCDSTNIPNEYQNAWSLYLTTAWTNKYDLDDLYWLKGDELVAAASNMMTTIEAGFTLIGEAIPNAVSKQVSIGEMISLEFVEMTMEYLNVSDKILPEDTDSSYSYIPDVENEQYFCIAGTLKNLSGASYDVESIYVEMVFDIYVQLNDGLCEEYYDYSPELYEILTHGCYTSFFPHEGERIYVRAGYKSCKRSIALSRLVGLYHTFFGKYGEDVEAFCKAIPALTTDYELEYDHVNACANIGCRENLIAVQSGLNRVKGELPKYFQLVGTSIFPLSDGDGHILVEYPSLTGKALYRRCESPEAFLDWLQFSMGRSVLTQNLEAVVGQYGDRASVKGFFTKPKGVVLEEVSFENWYHRKEAIVALYASEPDCFVPYRIGDYSDINKLVDELRRLTGQNVSVAISRIG